MRLTARALAIAAALFLSATAEAQQFTPTKTAVGPSGVKAVCDLPPSQHMRNTGGSDGYGLCVFTSCEIASRWMNVPELAGFQQWMTRRPGGGYPQKLDQMIAAFCREKGVAVPLYVQHTGGDDAFLDLAMRTDRMICVTYAGSDDFYRGGIDHMVCLAHIDSEWAAIIDNNRPGVWVWMSRKDFLARWRARGGGWAVVFLQSPPPPYPFAAAFALACYCGESCSCSSGECPNRCPVLVGQCQGGSCRLPSAPVVVPSAPVAPAASAGWVRHVSGQEWGYWRDGRRVAVCFADGRCEAVDGFGNANGVAIEPPAPLPVARQQAAPAAAEDANYGLDRDRIHQRPTYSISGIEVSRDEARAAVAGGSLADDSDRWHLTAVGDAAFVARFRADVAGLPDQVRGKLHVQGYSPDSWAVALFKLPAGVSLRKPSPARVGEDSGAVTTGDYTAAKLAELLGPVSGVKPVPKVDPPKVEPKPEPKPDAKPADPTPNPTPAPASIGGALLAILAAIGTLWAAVFRR